MFYDFDNEPEKDEFDREEDEFFDEFYGPVSKDEFECEREDDDDTCEHDKIDEDDENFITDLYYSEKTSRAR